MLYIQSANSVDLRSFVDGHLIFDLKVLDYGANTTGIAFKVDCGFPCTSGDQDLGIIAPNIWQTISIDVNTLVAAGLDLSRVNTGLVILRHYYMKHGLFVIFFYQDKSSPSFLSST